MSLDIAVYNALDAAEVTPLFRGWIPEGQEYPCVIVSYVSDRPRNTLSGESSHKNQTIQIDCLGATLEQAEMLLQQATQTMASVEFKAIRQSIEPDHDPETETFRFTIEYSVWSY